MVGKTVIINKLRKFKKSLHRDFPISHIIFFGSLAEGKGTESSDIDLILVSKGFSKLNFLKRASRMYDYWDIKMPVDFLCYTPEEFEKLKKQISIVSHAIKYGTAI